jgi:hypothetical protein
LIWRYDAHLTLLTLLRPHPLALVQAVAVQVLLAVLQTLKEQVLLQLQLQVLQQHLIQMRGLEASDSGLGCPPPDSPTASSCDTQQRKKQLAAHPSGATAKTACV